MRHKEVEVRRRFLFLLAVVSVAAGVLATTAAADRPEVIVEDVTGGQLACGDVLLTATEGTGVGRQHVHRLPSGLYRLTFRETLRGVRLTDGSTTYRAVGSIGGNFVTRDLESDEAIVSGFFRAKINVIGPDGLFGTVAFSERLTRSGQHSEVNRGTCDFADEEE